MNIAPATDAQGRKLPSFPEAAELMVFSFLERSLGYPSDEKAELFRACYVLLGKPKDALELLEIASHHEKIIPLVTHIFNGDLTRFQKAVSGIKKGSVTRESQYFNAVNTRQLSASDRQKFREIVEITAMLENEILKVNAALKASRKKGSTDA